MAAWCHQRRSAPTIIRSTKGVHPMRTHLPLFALPLAAAPIGGQNKSLIFSGRLPFKSLDAPNERVNGSINQLDEFDFSVVTPGPGALARSLQPATAHQAYLGDGNGDGNFTKFF